MSVPVPPHADAEAAVAPAVAAAPVAPTRRTEAANPRRVLWILLGSMAGTAIVAGASMAAQAPMLAPPLGGSAYLFFLRPTCAASAPRNAILGHLLGLLCGLGAAWICGLGDLPSVLVTGFTGWHALATAMALGATCALCAALDLDHPPAGATALIFGTAIFHGSFHIAAFLGGAVLLVAAAVAIHRAAGLAYPIWKPLPTPI